MTCDGCKWWSELCAQSLGGGPMYAMCLNSDSSHCSSMVMKRCAEYEAGVAVDDPSF